MSNWIDLPFKDFLKAHADCDPCLFNITFTVQRCCPKHGEMDERPIFLERSSLPITASGSLQESVAHAFENVFDKYNKLHCWDHQKSTGKLFDPLCRRVLKGTQTKITCPPVLFVSPGDFTQKSTKESPIIRFREETYHLVARSMYLPKKSHFIAHIKLPDLQWYHYDDCHNRGKLRGPFSSLPERPEGESQMYGFWVYVNELYSTNLAQASDK